MKILITSDGFYPAVGGTEAMTLMLSTEFARRGHDVVVVTGALSSEKDHFPFRVLRKPKTREFLEAARWCDVFFQNNISLKTLWPLFLVRRPWVVAHHTWIRRGDGSIGWQDRLKRLLLGHARSISISSAIADDLATESVVIGNPYLDRLFRVLPAVTKERDIVFLGRLVSDKGAHVLVKALHVLRSRGLAPTTTIIGSGPELDSLKRQVADLGLDQQVEFAGRKSGEDLVHQLNRHRIMVVPSVWNEPFGLVALEGMACGCLVVGSEGGGLKDAIGPCGLTFKNGDADGLAQQLEQLLRQPTLVAQLLTKAPDHLKERTLAQVADKYLAVLTLAANRQTAANLPT